MPASPRVVGSSHALETAAVRLYAEAEAASVRLRDPETALLFATLRRDEERHLATLERLLAAPPPRGSEAAGPANDPE
jgi:rubrerythrin